MGRRVWVSALRGLLAWLCCCTLGPVQGGKVLVMPVDGSHWLSMKLLVDELSQRGHEVVVLVPETTMVIKGSDFYRTEIFHVPYTKAELEGNAGQLKDQAFTKKPDITDIFTTVRRFVNFTSFQVKGCEGLLYDQPLMERLRGEGFEIMLTDPFLPCGPILAEAFSIPAVFFLRGIPCGLDEQAAQCPSPLSYVPRGFTGNPDRMNFLQRLKNVIISPVESYLCRIMFASFDELTSRYLEKDMTYTELLGHGAIWLHRYDYTFVDPRPRMPNMIQIGGINCKKSSPLSEEVEEFVEGSGEDGFVIFTLGSLVSEMPEKTAKQFFEAFRQIPQRVLWRYTGPVPENVPKNVKLMKWLPQNDLMGHPKAKAFISHGGSHGLYEGVCNGVPMVMFPLFGDQGDNAQRMAARGVAEVLSISEVTSDILVEALNKVINDKSYKEKMTKLSAVHLDRPVEPLDLAVYWTEFVMRHKGAEHLRVAAHDLNWIQYHSLDVFGLLILIVVVVVMVTVKGCSFCFHKYCMKRPSKGRKSEKKNK